MTGTGPKPGLDPALLLRAMGSADPPSEPALRPEEAARRAARRRAQIIDAMVEVASTDLEHSVNRQRSVSFEEPRSRRPTTGSGISCSVVPEAGDTGSLGVVAPAPAPVPRRLGAAAVGNVLLALGLVAALGLAWRVSSRPTQLPAPIAAVSVSSPEDAAKAGFGAYVHAQAGEVLVIGPNGPSVAPSPGGAGRALGAEERVATLGSGRATIHMGSATVVVLSPTSELRVRKGEGEAQVCELPSGTAQFTMTRQQTEVLHVQVPGGELSTSGASFRVSVEPGVPHSVLGSVSVVEGLVEVLLEGQPPVVLGAGDRWPAHPGPAITGAAPAPSAPGITGSAAGMNAAPAGLYRGRVADKQPAAPAPQTVLASQSSQLAAQNTLLAEALEAGKRGDVDAEAHSLDLFLSRYPQSPNAHDAVIARMRLAKHAGDVSVAVREANRYLDSFPSGPLREEAQTLLRRRRHHEPAPAVSAQVPFPKGT